MSLSTAVCLHVYLPTYRSTSVSTDTSPRHYSERTNRIDEYITSPRILVIIKKSATVFNTRHYSSRPILKILSPNNQNVSFDLFPYVICRFTQPVLFYSIINNYYIIISCYMYRYVCGALKLYRRVTSAYCHRVVTTRTSLNQRDSRCELLHRLYVSKFN